MTCAGPAVHTLLVQRSAPRCEHSCRGVCESGVGLAGTPRRSRAQATQCPLRFLPPAGRDVRVGGRVCDGGPHGVAALPLDHRLAALHFCAAALPVRWGPGGGRCWGGSDVQSVVGHLERFALRLGGACAAVCPPWANSASMAVVLPEHALSLSWNRPDRPPSPLLCPRARLPAKTVCPQMQVVGCASPCLQASRPWSGSTARGTAGSLPTRPMWQTPTCCSPGHHGTSSPEPRGKRRLAWGLHRLTAF